MSFLYQLVVFALKLPKATIKNGLLLMIELRINSKLLANVSKISRVLGDLYKQRKLLNLPPILISKLILSFKSWMSITFKGKE